MENPALIYEGAGDEDRFGFATANGASAARKTPLVLLHDGGGTTFSYHCLYPVGRPLWGIANERLDDGGYWEGGVPEMAARYLQMIEEDILPQGGDVLLGGWSFGGLLSLEIVWQLAQRPAAERRIHVLGIVMIDSVYPGRMSSVRSASALPAADAAPMVKPAAELKAMKLREKVDLNMWHARMMASRWALPRFRSAGLLAALPPAILLRAVDPVKKVVRDAQGDEVEEERSFVDYAREFPYLGWDLYDEAGGKAFIQKVVDVKGHHFSIFEEDNIRDITSKIARAADLLDEPDF